MMLRRVLYLVSVCSLIDDLLCLPLSENVVEQLVKDVMELKRLKTEQDKRIEEQGKMINEQGKIIELQRKLNEEQSKLNEEQDQRIVELGNQLMDKPLKDKRLLMSLPNSHQPVPAFSASLWQHVNLGKYQAITFDNVFTNIGNVNSPHSGAFTAPHNGTYYFVAVVMNHSGQYLETEICLNGKSLVYIYSRDNFYEQGTNSIILTLNQGDMVWVRHLGNEGSNVYGENWSSFSGFQIG